MLGEGAVFGEMALLSAQPRSATVGCVTDAEVLEVGRQSLAALAPGVERLRWLIEEFRVQVFAQELKTREPVSEKRLRKVVEELHREFAKRGLTF